MKNILFSITAALTLVLAGCGGDKAEAPEQAAPAADAAMESEPMAEMAMEMGATIDHSQDEQEFMLRRTIGGLERMIDQQRHRILKAPHPSPLSAHRGFFGCGHFAMINQYLEGRGQAPIDWSLPD